MAAPALASSASFADTSSQTSRTINKPSGTASGDVLRLYVSIDGTATIDTPTGFTPVFNQVEPAGSNMRLATFERVADGSEGATFTITTSSEIAAGIIVRITGGTASKTLDAVGVWGGELNAVRSAGVMPTHSMYAACPDGSLIIHIASVDDGTATFTAPGSTASIASVGANTSGTKLEAVYATVSSQGYIGQNSWTCSDNAEQGWAITEIIPASTSKTLPDQPVVRSMNALHMPTLTAATQLKPYGTADGDLLLLAQTVQGTAGLTPPGTFTSIQSASNGSNVTHQAYYRVASSEGSSYTVASASQNSLLSVLMRVENAATSSPINTSSSNTGSSATPTASTITPGVNDCLLLYTQGNNDDEVTTNGGYPSGWSGVYAESNDDGNDCGMIIARLEQTTAGATGSIAGSYAASEPWVAFLIAIAPATGDANITGTGYANSQAFGAGTVSPGAVTVTGTGYSNTNGFGSGTATSTYPLTGTGYANAQAFGGGTVAPGAVALTGTGYANANTFGSGTAAATYAVTGTGYANAQAFGTGTVAASYSIAGTGLATSYAFGEGTVSPGAVSVTGTGFANTNAFGEGSVAGEAGDQSVTGTGYANVNAFGSATISATYAVTGTGYANAQAFGTGTIAASYAVTASGFANPQGFGTGTLTATNTLTGTGYANDNQFGTGSASASYAITGTGLENAQGFGTASVTASNSVTGTGLESGNAFGSGTVEAAAVNIVGTGYANSQAFGAGTIVTLVPSGLNVYRVPAEIRVVTPANENRTVTPQTEARVLIVAAESRTYTVPTETRTYRIAA